MKLLVRATNWVGDAVMSIPALETVRAKWPQAEISVIARPWVADLYRVQPFADRVIPLSASANGLRGVERFTKELRRERFDCALLLQNAFSAAWLAWRAKIPQRIGYARDGRSALLTSAVHVPRSGEIPPHESYYYLELLRRAGWIDAWSQVEEIRLQVSSDAKESAEAQLLKAGIRTNSLRIAIAPGAAYGSAKCWIPERFAAVADGLVEDFGADVILFGADSEIGVSRQIASQMRHRPVNLAGQTTIGQLPALFSRCHLFVGNDSGAMHVAAAAGIPVVAVFGSTDPQGTAPVTPRRTLVQNLVSCSPCFLRECPVDHRCMTRVEVDDVRNAARRWLEGLPRG
ncbi:MAG TPA: lipopolysaccharide heptosyltransferase II [Candidatus Acidoferrales bacterium]|nr:lipopolysaccharide heptosyltransferase II [Candidatus Acidoferrales bacterium]